jgi:hypothetical protein
MTVPVVSVPTGTVALGHLGPIGTSGPGDRRGLLFHLRQAGVIVAPQTRQPAGWRCEIVAVPAGRDGTWRPRHVQVIGRELTEEETVLRIGPKDADLFALLWQVRVRQLGGGGRMALVANIMAGPLRTPGSLSVDVNPARVRRLLAAVNARPDGLSRILTRCTQAGMLTAVPLLRHAGSVVLTLPTQALRAWSGCGGDAGGGTIA